MARPKMEFAEPTTKEEEVRHSKRMWARENISRVKDNNNRINSAYKKLREINKTLLVAKSDNHKNFNYFGEGE